MFGFAAITSNLTVQLAFAGSVPAARVADAAPVVTEPAPQVVDAFGVGATASVAGSVSVNAAFVSAMPLGFVSVSVTVDGLPLP